MKRHHAINRLRKMFPDIHGIKSADDWGCKGAIHLGDIAEGGEINGLPAADIYASDPEEEVYIMGIHYRLRAALTDMGWFSEWHDSGTILAYEDN